MKLFILSISFLLILFSTNFIYCGGIDNKVNYSTEFIRSLNRNASTDSADASVYNPAGIMQFCEGNYLSLNTQYIDKNYWNVINNVNYETTKPTVLPTLCTVFRRKGWGSYFSVTAVAGGGKVEFLNGDGTTLGIGQRIILGSGGFYNNIKSQRLNAESEYIGYSAGFSINLSKKIALSIGAKYVDANKNAQASITLSGVAPDKTYQIDYEETADGIGGVIGLNLIPTDKINIGLRYESETKLNFKTKVFRDDIGMFTDGSTSNRALPAIMAIGISYDINNQFRIESDFTYYINTDAEWDWNKTKTGVNDGYDLGLVVEYDYNLRWTWSLGYLHTNTGLSADNMTLEAPELDADSFSAGFRYRLNKKTSINFGILKAYYIPDLTSKNITLDKDVTVYSLGLQAKF